MKLQKLVCAGVFGLTALIAAPLAGAADAFPQRPVTIVVPFPPGGTSDLMARTIAKGMTERLGVSVVVDNKGGGGTLIGSQHVARSAPDGYTLLLASTPHAINATLYTKIPYDTKKDFRTVAYMAEMPLVLAVAATSKVKSLQDLVNDMKTKKAELNYGSSGVGGSPHLATTLFLKEVGGQATHVPYRGSNPSVMDLAAGRTDFAFDTLYLIMTQVEAGKLRPVAQTGKTRHPRLPDVPTLAEYTKSNFEISSWFSIAAPSATPDAVVKKLNAAINDSLKDPKIEAFLKEQGMLITIGTADEAQARLLREIDTWGQAVAVSGAKIE